MKNIKLMEKNLKSSFNLCIGFIVRTRYSIFNFDSIDFLTTIGFTADEMNETIMVSSNATFCKGNDQFLRTFMLAHNKL